MRKALVVLCLLLVSVTASAQSFGDVLGFVIGNAIGDVVDAWKIYRVIQACDYNDPTVRRFAMDAAQPGTYSIVQVCDIFDAIRPPRWRYYGDPSVFGDSFTPASSSILSGLRGDCDDFSIVLAACIRAIGGTCWIRFTFPSDGTPGHAFAEVYVGNEEKAHSCAVYIAKRYHVEQVYTRHDDDGGCWIPLDWGRASPRSELRYPGNMPTSSMSTTARHLNAPIFNLLDLGSESLPVPAVP